MQTNPLIVAAVAIAVLCIGIVIGAFTQSRPTKYQIVKAVDLKPLDVVVVEAGVNTTKDQMLGISAAIKSAFPFNSTMVLRGGTIKVIRNNQEKADD